MQFSVPVTQNITLTFGTPILTAQVPDCEKMNRGLGAQVRAARQTDQGVGVSNYGGWQSTPDLWEWPSQEVAEYRRYVHDAILRIAALSTEEEDLSKVDVTYKAGSWANMNTDGDYNARHIHPDCDWAVVYYVETGHPDPDNERNGRLELHDPRILANISKLTRYGFARGMLVDPVPGKMVLFPAWIEHSVHPFFGAGDRISIACNVKITGGRHSGLV